MTFLFSVDDFVNPTWVGDIVDVGAIHATNVILGASNTFAPNMWKSQIQIRSSHLWKFVYSFVSSSLHNFVLLKLGNSLPEMYIRYCIFKHIISYHMAA